MPEESAFRFTIVPRGSFDYGAAFGVYLFRRTRDGETEFIAEDGARRVVGKNAATPSDSHLVALGVEELGELHATLHSILPNSAEQKIDTEALRAAVASEVKSALSEFFGKMAKGV